MTLLSTKTRFSAFAEPAPLDDYRSVTAPALTASTGKIVERIDDLLALHDQVAMTALGSGWTHVEGDLNPLFRYEIIRDLAAPHPASWGSEVEEGEKHDVGGRSSPSRNPRAAQLDESIADIQEWLGIGLDPATHAAGISRGTVYAWRARNSAPRPGTVGAVLRVHGLVAAAVKAVGPGRARAWFHAGDPSPLEALIAARGDANRIRSVSTQMREDLLIVPVPKPDHLLAATVLDATE